MNPNTEMIVPEVFTNPDFKYEGTYEEKKLMIKADMYAWKGLCYAGQSIGTEAWKIALITMRTAIKYDDFSKISDEVINAR